MCTVVLATGMSDEWPLLLAANRDERLDRPWSPPAAHWPGQPDVIAGRDHLGGGTWLGLNAAGLVAIVLNRAGSLGPAIGKRSRGELPLLALRHGDAASACAQLAGEDAGQWRSFNLVLADRRGAFFLCGTGAGPITASAFARGVHMVTAHDPNDPESPRVSRHLAGFRAARLPSPPDWGAWAGLLEDRRPPVQAAMCVPPTDGFGTVTSTLLALGTSLGTAWGTAAHFLTTPGPPGAGPFEPVLAPLCATR